MTNHAGDFTAATIVPALASAIKQAQREASAELHVLADYHARAEGQSPPPLTSAEQRAARELGVVMVEQGFNSAVLFLMVNAAAALVGPAGGMLAQVGITWNTVVTPEQTQRINPARVIGLRPDWVRRLPRGGQVRFASLCGQFARSCGYGCRASASPTLAPVR